MPAAAFAGPPRVRAVRLPAQVLAALGLLGLALGLTVQAAWVLQPQPALLRAMPVAWTALAVASPRWALALLAALGPLSGALSVALASPFSGAHLLEQMMVATAVGATVRLRRDAPPARLAGPAAIFGVIVLAAALAVQPALLLLLETGTPASAHLPLLVTSAYLERWPSWVPLASAAVILEGLAVAVTAERVLRRHPDWTRVTLAMAVLGLAGVGVLNLERLVTAALRSGDLVGTAVHLAVNLRVSRFYDVNAAGSVFALAALAAIGLLVSARRTRLPWLLVVAVLAGALWVTGSRSALAAAVSVTTVLFVLGAARSRGAGRTVYLGAIGVVLLGAALVALAYPVSRNAQVPQAMGVRSVMAATSLNMWRSAPVFGIGTGRFQPESTGFGAMALRDVPYPATSENAHNNFLQVLAEQGLAGLLALLVLLGSVLAAAVRAERGASTPERRWLLAGLVAFLLTWMTGHPLLVPEASFVFWLLLGLLAGLAPPPPARASTVVALAVVLVIASVPFRAAVGLARVDMEHRAAGTSGWHVDGDGRRYREAGARFTLYLPADGTPTWLPVRRAPGAPDPVRLAFSVGRERLNEVTIAGDDWHRVLVVVRPGVRQYAAVTFDVSPAPPSAIFVPLVHLGRGAPH